MLVLACHVGVHVFTADLKKAHVPHTKYLKKNTCDFLFLVMAVYLVDSNLVPTDLWRAVTAMSDDEGM